MVEWISCLNFQSSGALIAHNADGEILQPSQVCWLSYRVHTDSRIGMRFIESVEKRLFQTPILQTLAFLSSRWPLRLPIHFMTWAELKEDKAFLCSKLNWVIWGMFLASVFFSFTTFKGSQKLFVLRTHDRKLVLESDRNMNWCFWATCVYGGRDQRSHLLAKQITKAETESSGILMVIMGMCWLLLVGWDVIWQIGISRTFQQLVDHLLKAFNPTGIKPSTLEEIWYHTGI